MGKPRIDTYDQESITYSSFLEAWKRKQDLIKEGYRVKIWKDADGAYTIQKKHVELFHDQSWRKKHG